MRLPGGGKTELLLEISPSMAQWEHLEGVGEQLPTQHQWLLPTLAKFPGASRQLFVSFLDTCRYETTSELTREGPSRAVFQTINSTTN